MPYAMRDDSQVSISYLGLPPLLAFIFSIIALGGAFSSAYTLPSSTSTFSCPIVFLSNIASMYLSRMFITYFCTISACLVGIAIFIQYVDIKLRLQWVNTEDEIPKFFFMNKLSLLCGILSVLGLIGTVSFPFEGMPVIQSLYPILNTSNITSNIKVAVNMIHMVNVVMFYSGFFLFAWIVFILNVRTRSVFSALPRVYFLCTQCILLLIFTLFLHSTVISMILMTVFYHTQPETRTNVGNLCWEQESFGYYSHIVAIGSQYIATLTLFLLCLTIIPPLRRKRISLAIELPHSYVVDSDRASQDTVPTVPPVDSINECKQVNAPRRDTVSESSGVLYGNHNIDSHSNTNSVLDLFRETNL